jgi:MFS transporter, PHS family, inorganic phosphate transporter
MNRFGQTSDNLIKSPEWASKRSRPRMLASVFIMQPIGQLCAYLIGLIALGILNRQHHLSTMTDPDELRYYIDKHWRWVTGLGAIPAVIALIFRLTIPESGRWTLDVREDANRALLETREHYGTPNNATRTDLSAEDDEDLEEDVDDCDDASVGNTTENLSTKETYWGQLRNYFIINGNWRYLAGTSLCWFLLDFAYYGIQINNPRLLAKLFAKRVALPPNPYPSWLSDPSFPNTPNTISRVISENSTRAMIATSIGSILGSLILIWIIPYISRRKFLIWSFLGLGVLMAVQGGSYLATFQHPSYIVTLILFILSQLLFNLGPNTLTFIVSRISNV